MAGLVPSLLSDEAESKKKFKAKIVLGTKRVGKWEKRAFKNPGRVDGAAFFHWQKAKVLEASYKFSKFNRKLAIPKYRDDEYAAHFASAQWSREETDYLFEMCDTWDLRFIVMVDRWCPPASAIKPQRTVEELKDRYYSIQRALLPLRKVSEEELATHPLLLHPYDPVRETERKRQQNQATQRSDEEIALETEITAECARVDATFKRHSEDALKYLRLVKKQQKYYANLKLERAAYHAAKELDERARAAKLRQTPSPAPAATANMDVDASANNSPQTLQPTNANAAAQAVQKVTRRHPAAYSRTHAKAYTTTLVPLLNQQKYANLYARAMPELGIDSVSRSSFILIAAVTELRCDLLLLHEMQRLHAEKAYELEVLRTLHNTLQERLKTTTSTTAPTALSKPPTPSPLPFQSSQKALPPQKTPPAAHMAPLAPTVALASTASAMDVDK